MDKTQNTEADLTPIKINAVLSGKTKEYTFSNPYSSAIDKRPVEGLVLLTSEGINTDEQADCKVHGGKDKALHHYPFEHYEYWRKKLAPLSEDLSVLDMPGAFGENISTIGLTEENLCIGDEFSIGDDEVFVQISQSRQPCWKLNQRFNAPDMSAYVQETGKTGWYYRVLQGGQFSNQSSMKLLNRPYPQWPLNRVNQVMFATKMNRPLFEDFLKLPLPPSWQQTIEKRLSDNQIESMSKRLYGSNS